MKEKESSAFRSARFGMFIHWGLYSILGGRWKGEQMEYIGEWIQSRYRIPNAEYAELAKEFNPVYFDADEWIRRAKEAGMGYIVFTTKHHDGFAMYHSEVDHFNIVEATPFKRDILRELADACQRHGVALGIYYSHCIDWRDPNGADPGPNYSKNFGMSWGNDWDYPDYATKNFKRYFEQKALPQIRELLTNYGPIFSLWLDCPMVLTRQETEELYRTIKAIQPECCVSSRIGYGLGDYACLGDNQSPAGKNDFPLESARTLNHTWGYKEDDHNWQTSASVIGDILATNEKDANLLLNIGPKPDGSFPEPSIEVLSDIAKWRKENNVEFRNTISNPFPQSFPWGWCMVNGNTLQFFVRDQVKSLDIYGIESKIVSCNMPFQQDADGLHIQLTRQPGETPLVIHAEFAPPLKINQLLTPQNGALTLSPETGTLIHGERFSSGETRVGPAAEILEENETCSLDATGALTQWHHPGDGIRWNISLPEGGRYRIWLITENRCHSAPWVGDRRIQLEFAGKRLETELTESERFHSPFYARSASQVGEIELPAGTCGELKLITLGISSTEAVNMNLTAVRIDQTDGRQRA